MLDSFILYHWTSDEAIHQIQRQGLVPRNGHHCKKIHHTGSDMIYLCKKEDIQFWRNCFYDSDVLIEIECTYLRANLKRRPLSSCPSGYEYSHRGIILPKYFNRVLAIYRGDRDDLKDRYDEYWKLRLGGIR